MSAPRTPEDHAEGPTVDLLGTVGVVAFALVTTTEPWRTAIDTLVISGGPSGGLGQLGGAVRRQFPAASWDLDLSRLEPGSSIGVELVDADRDSTSSALQRVIVVTVRELQQPGVDGRPTLAAVGRAVTTALDNAPLLGT